MDPESFCADLCNIARVLPNVPVSTIYRELTKLGDNLNRVQIVLRHLFASYDADTYNSFSDDIKKIRRVIPEYSFINVTSKLLEFGDRPNRVQLVLKHYFEKENCVSKRPHRGDSGLSPTKKIKSETDDKSKVFDTQQSCTQTKCQNEALEFQNNLPENGIKNEMKHFDENHDNSSKIKVKLQDSNNTNVDDGFNGPILLFLCTMYPQLSVNTIINVCHSLGYNNLNEKINKTVIESIENALKNNLVNEVQVTNTKLEPLDGSSITIKDEVNSSGSTEEYNIVDLEEPNIKIEKDLIEMQNTEKPCSKNMRPSSVNAPPVIRYTPMLNLGTFRPAPSPVDLSVSDDNYNNMGLDLDLPTCKKILSMSKNAMSHTFGGPAVFEPKVPKIRICKVYNNANAVASTSKDNNNDFNNILRLACPSTSKQKKKIKHEFNTYDTYFNGPLIRIIEEDLESSENNDVEFVSEQDSQSFTYESIIDLTNSEDGLENDVINHPDSLNQPSTSSGCKHHHPFYFKLLEIFPDICPNYLKKFCLETEFDEIDDLINCLLNTNYRKRNQPIIEEHHEDLQFDEQLKLLNDLFPDADPTYLQHHCERLIHDPRDFKIFVASLFESKKYPTKGEYLKKLKLSAQEKQYTTEFDVKKYLEIIPDPESFFDDRRKRQISFENFDDTNYAITFLKNHFRQCTAKDIISLFRRVKFSVIEAAKHLEKMKKLKIKRRLYPVTSCTNIPLLQEIAFVQHKKKILDYIEHQKKAKLKAREDAKEAGLMKSCSCCYDDEIMPDEVASCESGEHEFCKDCVRKGCEVVIGLGKLDFPCFQNCESFFTLQVLQAVLDPKVFSKMAQRKQVEEVKSAGIEDLEFCPFCDFAIIPAPGDKIFRCLNPDCMKESCRLCKEPSHIPLRCDELEKDNDVRMRTYIEDKMTEALLRKCYKCGLKFVKESGCNKMTCSCGAMMCYICNQPVKDYRHFNGPGGDQLHLCPLHSDTNKLHMEEVKLSAQAAKFELGINQTNQLKIDPTVNLEEHYRQLTDDNNDQMIMM